MEYPKITKVDNQTTYLNVKFFLNVCTAADSNLPENIKGHLGAICQLTAKWSNITLPIKFNGKHKVCQYCLCQWNDTNCKVKIKPSIKPSKAIRRILAKVDKNKKLSEVEKKLALRAHSGNKIEITCLLCKKKTGILVNKPKKVIEVGGEECINLKVKKKKKRKKTPILNLPSSPSVTLNIEDTTDDIMVIDCCGQSSSKSGRKISENFIPLDASTPMANQKKKKKLYANPLALKSVDSFASRQKRLLSLKKLLAEDAPKSPRVANSLKGFLSNL